MKKVAFCYSTKDRTQYTRRTLLPVLAEADNFDLFWVDGSATSEGLALFEGAPTSGPTIEKHGHVTGGADVAIVYSLSMMLERGYEYVGLIENDVLLEPGWFDRIFQLFATPGLNVGSVSARSYADRVLLPRNGFAIMANVGAGMVLFKRAAAEAVLDHFRSPSFREYVFLPRYLMDLPCPTPHEVPDANAHWQLTADWSFESSMMAHGMVALACTPSMARTVDTNIEILVGERTKADASVKAEVADKPEVPIGRFDFERSAWCQQPHQIVKAFPNAFAGGWKLIWARHNGPFGLKSTSASDNLTLPVYASEVHILVEVEHDNTLCAIHDADSYPTQPDRLLKKGGHFLHASLGPPGTRGINMKVSFTQPGVTVMTAFFDLPQPWFRARDELRYRDLKPFL